MRLRHLRLGRTLRTATLGTAALLLATVLTPSAWAVCGIVADADLTAERARAEHDLNAKTQQLEGARVALKLKDAAYTAATAELAKTPEASANQVHLAAAELREAEETKKESEDALRAAEDKRDCVLRQMLWAGSLTLPARIAGGAGGRWMLGAGVRLNVRTTSSPRELHHFGIDYLSLQKFGFNERDYEAAGTGERVLSAYYRYRYKNLIIGPAAATRVSKRSNDGEMVHPNGWLIGHVGFDIDAELALPGLCARGCGVASGSLFVEPWFPMSGDVPVSVVVGVEFQFGGGWGVAAPKTGEKKDEKTGGGKDKPEEAAAK
jgi:hypothetical protein